MQPWARTCAWGFFIGPDKAGSSWVQAVLERHPTVAVPRAKDLHYFNRFFDRGLDWYLDHFDVDERTTCAVEVCHDYLFDPSAIARLAATFPDARLVVCARHPADRALSSYLYMLRQGRTRLDLSRALREIDELVDHGRYHEHLVAVLEHVELERITVLDFGQLQEDPGAFKANLLAGLGAEPQPLVSEDREPVRVAAAPRSHLAARAAKLTAGALRRLRAERLLGRLKSSPAVERALFRAYPAGRKPSLSSSDLWYLRTILEPDGEALDRLLGTRFQQDWWHGTNVDGTEFRRRWRG